MKETKKQYDDIDEYISLFPQDVRDILSRIRIMIVELVPTAKESISYGMPTFKLKGNLIHFAAYKEHIGFYPTPSAIEFFKDELKNYKTAKGSIQFPLDKKIPYSLIKKIVRYRVKEVLNKA